MRDEQRLALASLAEGTRARLEGDSLVVVFDFEFNMQEFQAQLLDTREQGWLKSAIEERFGRALEIRCTMEEGSEGRGQPAVAEPSEHEMLTRVRGIFPEAEASAGGSEGAAGGGSAAKSASAKGARGTTKGGKGKRAGG